MKIIYRYVGKSPLTRGRVIKPGQFISKALYNDLDEALTIRQEIR